MGRKIILYLLVLMDTINILLNLIVRAGGRTFSEEMSICLTEFREVKEDRLGPFLKKKKPSKGIPFLEFIRLIPKATREEFISDVQIMIYDLRKMNISERHLKIKILKHFLSPIYFALLDIIKGYFTLRSKNSKND